ncbi:MAG: PocR ligand-binding domain-containing protein [Lachnospiraceae bacterium]|nr:PocR ligand-binding domain-containing protein [Lachnospiraceae bacterium]
MLIDDLRLEIDEDLKNNLTLTDLISVDVLQKLQDSFAGVTQMASLITDAEGIPVTKGTNFSGLCMDFCRKSEKGLKRCEECDRKGAQMSLEKKGPISYFCHANMVDFAAPIMLGDRMLGSFIGGQVLTEKPDPEKMREIARELQLDEDSFVEAAMQTHIVPQEEIDRATRFIYEFAASMSDMAYKEFLSKELSRKALEAAVQKSDFLANMSHEIRTPMNAVLGLSEVALRENMSDSLREYLEQIQAAGRNLLVIIDDILDLSKIESGKLNINEINYEPARIVQELIPLIAGKMDEKGLDFIVDYSMDLPKELCGDKVRLQQIFLNLLSNAAKFTAAGQVRMKIYHEALAEDKILLKVEVTDTGIGIKASDMQKLFTSFQQLDARRSRQNEGAGLGLAISKNLVEMMGGKITVQSEFGEGTTFTVSVPQKIVVRRAEVQPLPENIFVGSMLKNKTAQEALAKDLEAIGQGKVTYRELEDLSAMEQGYCIMDAKFFDENALLYLKNHAEIQCFLLVPFDYAGKIHLPNVTMLRKPVYAAVLQEAFGLLASEKRSQRTARTQFAYIAPEISVLAVDDNKVNLLVTTKILAPLKMQIDTAMSGKEAIEMAGKTKYDIILMDHMMPEMDGVEATHRIRQEVPGYEKTPVIALTANVVDGTREMLLKEGLDDFAAKPIKPKDLVTLLAKWIPEDKMMKVEEPV